MKKIIKSIKRWIRYYYERIFMFIFAFMNFGMFITSFQQNAVLYKGETVTVMFYHVFGFIFLIFEAIHLYSHFQLVKGTSKKVSRTPYRVALGIHDKDEILSLLEEKLQFNQIDDHCQYAEEDNFIWWALESIEKRVFVFRFDDNEQNNDLEIADSYVRKVNEMTNFVPGRRFRTNRLTYKHQIFIYDKVPKTVLDTAQYTVERDNWKRDILTNFFIDLSEGTMYIPFMCTRLDVGVKHVPYLNAIKDVARYLELQDAKARETDTKTINIVFNRKKSILIPQTDLTGNAAVENSKKAVILTALVLLPPFVMNLMNISWARAALDQNPQFDFMVLLILLMFPITFAVLVLRELIRCRGYSPEEKKYIKASEGVRGRLLFAYCTEKLKRNRMIWLELLPDIFVTLPLAGVSFIFWYIGNAVISMILCAVTLLVITFSFQDLFMAATLADYDKEDLFCVGWDSRVYRCEKS